VLCGEPVSACATRFITAVSLAAALLSTTAVLAPASARASDGYEIAFPLAVTFIVATSVGLTDRDDGWAALELVYGLAGIAACSGGAAYAFDQHVDGLGGALILQGIGSVIFAAFGIAGLESEHPPNLDVAIVPAPDGVRVSASFAL
jgi:hypothetical protein